MGFFHVGPQNKPTSIGHSIDLLHKHQCQVCPLNHQAGLRHPQMQPYGTDKPLVYILGEAPGKDEDRVGRPFVGVAGRTLRFRLDDDWLPHLRWNNCVRTRPPNNQTPGPVEIECCRPSVEHDIAATKPKAIFGFGNVPLHWMIKQSGISNWRGRMIPVNILGHSCWFFPMFHPQYINYQRRYEPRDTDSYGCDEEFAFALDLKRAFGLIRTMPPAIVHSKELALEDIEWVTGQRHERDLAAVREALQIAAREPTVGIDYECNALRPYASGAKILSVSVATPQRSLAFALEHRQAEWTARELVQVKELWQRFLHRAPCRKVSHNVTFEMEWSATKFDKDCLRDTKWGDTQSQAYVLDERIGMLSLEDLGIQYFGINLKAINNLDRKNLDKHELRDVLQYNGLDSKYHLLLYHAQLRRLKDEGLMPVYHEQLRRAATMVLTQIKGVPVDQNVVHKFYKDYKRQLREIERELYDLPIAKEFAARRGHQYRPASPHDVRYLLQTMLKQHGIENADKKALHAVKHPITKVTLRWRHVNKLLSTYVLPLRPDSPHIFPDKMLHPTYNIYSTRTWRTSTEGPNIQNFPKRQTIETRSQIRPGGPYRVVSFDYGQIQARNIAMESKDKALIKSFWERYDIHSDWMERIVSAVPSWHGGRKALQDPKVRKGARNAAKNEFVFPSFFGARAPSLAGYLGIPEAVTAKLQTQLWTMFPDIHGWQERTIAQYFKLGYVSGLSGFRRHAPVATNELINAPIQADEAMIVCDAMTRLSQQDHDKLQASMEIHDDLTFIWHKDEIDELAEIVISTMLSVPYAWARIVPIVVEMGIGQDWGSIKEVATYSSDTWKGAEPNTGNWSDGTGWANSDGFENSFKAGRRRRAV